MIESLVRSALKQRLIVAVIAAVLFFFGLNAAQKLSVDAFPDVTNVQVQIATEAPGRSPEEVERFATVPLEVAMTGLPGLEEMRSLNKPGLSLITLVFTDATDVYFARQLVMERLLEVGSRLPEGITPVLGPVSTGLGEVYQYTLERADDGNRALTQEELMQRRIAQDWVVRPLLRSIPGVAEINSQGGFAKQYQVLVNPDRLRHFGLSVSDVYMAVARNNANAGGGVLPQYAEQYLIRGIGLVRDVEDLRAIVLYLRSLPQEDGPAPPTARPSGAVMEKGRDIYRQQCVQCHGEQGEGRRGAFPTLAGNRAVLLADTTNLVQVVLRGGYLPQLQQLAQVIVAGAGEGRGRRRRWGATLIPGWSCV